MPAIVPASPHGERPARAAPHRLGAALARPTTLRPSNCCRQARRGRGSGGVSAAPTWEMLTDRLSSFERLAPAPADDSPAAMAVSHRRKAIGARGSAAHSEVIFGKLHRVFISRLSAVSRAGDPFTKPSRSPPPWRHCRSWLLLQGEEGEMRRGGEAEAGRLVICRERTSPAMAIGRMAGHLAPPRRRAGLRRGKRRYVFDEALVISNMTC